MRHELLPATTQDSASRPQPHAPRLYHKKSRTGCQRCKARRVKCDEKRPVCSGCHRHDMPCVYTAPKPKEPPRSTPPRPSFSKSSSDEIPGISFDFSELTTGSISPGSTASTAPHPYASPPISSPEDKDDNPSESRARRIAELKLIQNYVRNISEPFHQATTNSLPLFSSDNPLSTLWTVDVPALGFENDNLLYAMHTLSTTHLLKSRPRNHKLISTRQIYHSLALREQRKAVSGLASGLANADAVCFASMLLSMDSFARLSERKPSTPSSSVFTPYSPPMEWLHMSQGSGVLFRMTLSLSSPSATSSSTKIALLLNSPPSLADHALFTPLNVAPYTAVLARHEPAYLEAPGLWDPEVRDAYERTLSLIGSMRLAIEAGEPIYAVGRRLMAFAMLVPKKFIELVEEMRPRALVILGLFFNVADQFRNVWWIGDAAGREGAGIRGFVGREWKDVLEGCCIPGTTAVGFQHLSSMM